MKIKNMLVFLICIIVAVSMFLPVYACEENDNGRESTANSVFKDVGAGHWAYEAVNFMANRGIISGYGDSTFKPDKAVTRAEFAKMMVLALDLSLKKPETGSFVDVKQNNWAYTYVETAKYYLTGFRTSDGDYFRPDEQAVREDMAVALVKAMEYADESLLDVFADRAEISPNLMKYVAIAVKNNIMQGYAVGDSREFGPQKALTRAEAAVLLFNVVKDDQEKVTYDDEKVTYDNQQQNGAYTIPQLYAQIENGGIVLRWQAIADERLTGYKVVISKNNSAPKYPDDGYYAWITDRNTTSVVVKSGDSYNSGDFGGILAAGQEYYFSITAVYDNAKVPGNVIQMVVPDSSNAD